MAKIKAKNEQEQKNFMIKAVRNFFKVSQTKKNVDNAFAEQKNDFENIMDLLYERFSEQDGNLHVSTTIESEKEIVVHKVQTSKVTWNISKLKEVILPKDAENIFGKKYTIVNFQLLIKLAKEYKIPWKKFKQCIEVEEYVKDEELDKLIDLGIVDSDKVKECASIKLNKPYYKLTEK